MKKYLFLLGTVLSISSCFSGSQDYELKDVMKAEVIILKKELRQGNIQAITISGKGQISGEAKIILVLNEKPYKIENLSGKVNFQWGGDWYSDTAEIRYHPMSVDGGQLQITYRFKDM